MGKSNDEDCNKMAGFDLIKFLPTSKAPCQDGEIRFYFEPNASKKLYIHFKTPFDTQIMEEMLLKRALNEFTVSAPLHEDDEEKTSSPPASFHSLIRSRFAQILLFAIQVCHVIVLVETNNVFDTSYLSIFRALKIIRYLSICLLPVINDYE